MRRIRNFCFKSIISPFQVSYCCLRHDTSPTSYNPARSAPRALRRLSVPPQGPVQTIRLPRVFLNRDSRPTAQIFADTSHGRESPRYLAVTSGHGHRGRRAHLFFAANQQVPRPFYERSWTAPLHRKVGLKSTNELIRINSGATKARMLTFMLMSGPGQKAKLWGDQRMSALTQSADLPRLRVHLQPPLWRPVVRSGLQRPNVKDDQFLISRIFP